MKENDMTSELEQVISAVLRSIPLRTFELTDEFFPAHLSVALIDAVFRTRFPHSESSIPAAERYCRHFRIAPTRADRWNPPPANMQETLGDLSRHYDELGLDAITNEVLGIRRGFPEQKVTRAAIVLRAARTLRGIGVDTLQDISTRHSDEIRDALLSLPRIGEHTVRRLLMYTGGDDFVLGDADVRRFVASAIGRKTVSSDRAVALVRSAAYELVVSPRFLDREIWPYGVSR